MKQSSTRLSQRYVAALGRHLRPGRRASLQPALRLGGQAVVLRMETLELARIHERALTTLELSSRKNGWLKRAEHFFAEALTPIVETHRAARQSRLDLSCLKETLSQRTRKLATTNRQMQRGVRRNVLADDFQKRGQDQSKCLDESLQLQQRLRQLTHQVLAAPETARAKISHELRDEIAQTWLGINVRLLSLKQQARSDTSGLKHQIASAQRLVMNSAKSVRQFARKLDTPSPIPGARPASRSEARCAGLPQPRALPTGS